MVGNIKNAALLFFYSYTFLCSPLHANDNLELIKSKYHDEMAVFLKYNESVTINVVGDSLKIVSQVYREMLHLDEKSKIFANDQVYENHFVGISELEASTFIPYKRNRYKEYKVEEFKESFNKSSSFFFDDGRNYSFTYPAIQTGAKTLLKYKEEYKDPHILSRYYFSSYIPVVSAEFTVKAHKNVSMRFHVINGDKHPVEQSRSVQGDYIIYKFKAKDVPKFNREPTAPEIGFYEPHLICAIEKYKTAGGATHNVLSSVEDLYQWYLGFIDAIKPPEKDNLSAIVKSIVTDEMTEIEKVKAIYYWVQDNIKYIAFEDGMRGFIPHSGGYVCEKRYGDCKDMSSILVDMLAVAGIKAHYTWIGTRDIPYTYRKHYSPAVDNHMIATYFHHGKTYFLDATSQFAALGQPSSMIQGKEALISIDRENFRIEKVPVISAEQNLAIDSCYFRLRENDLVGTGTLTLTGYNKLFNSFYLIEPNKRTVEKRVQNLLKKGNNKFFVEEFEIENLQDRDSNIVITYKIRIEDYFKKAGNRIYINLNLDKEMATGLIDEETRKLNIVSEFKTQLIFNHYFELPENYQVNYMPEKKTLSNELVDFNLEYSQHNNIVKAHKTISRKYLEIKKDEFGVWNNSVKFINNAYNDSAILENQ